MPAEAVDVLPSGDAYPLGHSMDAPLYTQAILFPALAFPAWILCFPSMVWHFRQANVAAGSIILWLMFHNFFNSINALIWPRDNLFEWWNGSVWCDIHVRIQVGSYVGVAASAAMITRKLAGVMDTRNITVSSSRNSKIRENISEIIWCWGFPLVLVVVYYVVQPARYIIYGIVGCLPAYDTSWPSIVLSIMWFPITTLSATYWSILLVYRLHRYRKEFHRLVAAQNTTKSRFIRLFILGMAISLVYLGYSVYIIVAASLVMTNPFSWSHVHDPVLFNTIIRVPVQGKVAYDKWIQVFTGYVVFLLFGTGVDAHNFYKKILVSVGLGKVWPSLYQPSESGHRTPSSFIAARSWTSSMSSKARELLWSSGSDSIASIGDVSKNDLRNSSIILESVPSPHDGDSEGALMGEKQGENERRATKPRPSSFKTWLARSNHRSPLLPLFNYRNLVRRTTAEAGIPKVLTNSSGVHAHAWATEDAAVGCADEGDGVLVFQELHQDHHDKHHNEGDFKSNYDWAVKHV